MRSTGARSLNRNSSPGCSALKETSDGAQKFTSAKSAQRRRWSNQPRSVTATTSLTGIADRYAPPFRASLSPLPGLNLTVVEAATCTGSPVLGLRPSRAARRSVSKLPKRISARGSLPHRPLASTGLRLRHVLGQGGVELSSPQLIPAVGSSDG